MDILKLFDLVGGWVSKFQAGRLDRRVQEIVIDLLKDEEFSKRSFEKILHETAVFEDDPKQLRKLLLLVGARRYSASNGDELWGLPERNKSEDAVDKHPNSTKGIITTVTLGILASLFGAGLYDVLKPTIDCLQVDTFEEKLECDR